MFLNKRVPVLFLYHVFLICFAFVSSHIMNATDVNPLFYSALLLSALPVPLLRQVHLQANASAADLSEIRCLGAWRVS